MRFRFQFGNLIVLNRKRKSENGDKFRFSSKMHIKAERFEAVLYYSVLRIKQVEAIRFNFNNGTVTVIYFTIYSLSEILWPSVACNKSFVT